MVGPISACADEGDHLGRIDELGVEDVDDFGEDGGSFPRSGDEEAGWFRHCGWRRWSPAVKRIGTCCATYRV